MRRYQHFIIGFYAKLLRLYPPQFRTEFADEMHEVFAQTISETPHTLALLSLVSIELRDLPLLLIQEHLRERQKRALISHSGVMVMESGLSLRLFRIFSSSLFIACAAFILLPVLPFYTLGLHTQSMMEVISGALGPEAFPLYSTGLIYPNPLTSVAFWVLLGAPAWGVTFGGGVLLMLAMFWKRLAPRHRWTGMLAVVAGIMPLVYLFLPTGKILVSWWMN